MCLKIAVIIIKFKRNAFVTIWADNSLFVIEHIEINENIFSAVRTFDFEKLIVIIVKVIKIIVIVEIVVIVIVHEIFKIRKIFIDFIYLKLQLLMLVRQIFKFFGYILYCVKQL